MPNIIPKIVQWIALILLFYFGLVLILPLFAIFWPQLAQFKAEQDTKQTLFNLVTAVVFFFIGKNSDSAKKDDQSFALATQLGNSTPTPPLGTSPTGKPGDPVAVHNEGSTP